MQFPLLPFLNVCGIKWNNTGRPYSPIPIPFFSIKYFREKKERMQFQPSQVH